MRKLRQEKITKPVVIIWNEVTEKGANPISLNVKPVCTSQCLQYLLPHSSVTGILILFFTKTRNLIVIGGSTLLITLFKQFLLEPYRFYLLNKISVRLLCPSHCSHLSSAYHYLSPRLSYTLQISRTASLFFVKSNPHTAAYSSYLRKDQYLSSATWVNETFYPGITNTL